MPDIKLILSNHDPNNPHKYFKFSSRPKNEKYSLIAKEILWSTTKMRKSGNQWNKLNQRMQITWSHPEIGIESKTSKKFNYKDIIKHLKENSSFEFELFDLPKTRCIWLDDSIDLKFNAHLYNEDDENSTNFKDETLQRNYGQDFPIKPRIDREGAIYTTFLPQLLKRVTAKRKELVETSHNALSDDWIFEFRELINNTISLLDITLNQIYTKAEYDPKQGWTFDIEKIGSKYGRRILDKLKWIYQISGNRLNCENYIESLKEIKNLRNHLNHFDPPCLVITLEEVCKWLNQITDIGMLLIKIRQTLNLNISEPLISFVLQKIIIFVPEVSSPKRKRLDKTEFGYNSGNW